MVGWHACIKQILVFSRSGIWLTLQLMWLVVSLGKGTVVKGSLISFFSA